MGAAVPRSAERQPYVEQAQVDKRRYDSELRAFHTSHESQHWPQLPAVPTSPPLHPVGSASQPTSPSQQGGAEYKQPPPEQQQQQEQLERYLALQAIVANLAGQQGQMPVAAPQMPGGMGVGPSPGSAFHQFGMMPPEPLLPPLPLPMAAILPFELGPQQQQQQPEQQQQQPQQQEPLEGQQQGEGAAPVPVAGDPLSQLLQSLLQTRQRGQEGR